MNKFTLIFIIFIPTLIALGHDSYLFYTEHMTPDFQISVDMIMEKFQLSALGFIWTTYHEESYKLAFESLSSENWQILERILTYKAVYAGLGFAALILGPLALMGLIGKGPLAIEGGIVYASSARKRRNKYKP